MTSSVPVVNGVPSGSTRAARQGSSTQRGARKARMKNRGSQTCSSDDDDLHSDDNLRPYEEVKVAHHDKKLAGLGLTPDEHAVSPIMSANPQTKQKARPAGHAYSYGSDDESDARITTQVRPSAYQPQPQPRQILQQQDHVLYDPPWDHINFDQMRSAHRAGHTSESDEDNRHAMQRYSQAGTLPMPPPTFPPPPPPPIEDIPQRSPAPTRQRSFGPSVRGNYSDADFRRQQTFGDGEQEMPLENPYLVQNALGAAYSMDGQIRYQHPRPPMHRSGSVPSGHSHSMDVSDHYMSSGHSDTYPYHCPNVGDGPVIVHSSDRQLAAYPPFGGPPSIPAGSYPPSQDYRYYFSSAGSRMKKKLGQRCTWRCTALILLVMCVGLLACTVYFAGE